MALDPAYHVPLTDEQLKLLGSIAAIQSQFEWQMVLAVQSVLDVAGTTAARILGTTQLETKAEVWLHIIAQKKPELAAIAQEVRDTLAIYAPLRNNLFHSAFVEVPTREDGTPVDGAYALSTAPFGMGNPTAAIKTKTLQHIPLENADYVRDLAAYISILVAHVTVCVQWNDAKHSVWSDKLPQRPLAPPKAKIPNRQTSPQ